MDGHPTTPSLSANVGMSKIAHLLSRWQNQDCPSSSFYIYIFVCVCVCVCVCVKSLQFCLFETLWAVTYQVPLSRGFSRQQCWSGLPFPLPGDLANPGTKPVSSVPCIGRWVLYRYCLLGGPIYSHLYLTSKGLFMR